MPHISSLLRLGKSNWGNPPPRRPAASCVHTSTAKRRSTLIISSTCQGAGSLVSRMSAVLPIPMFRARARTTGNRQEQAFSGAPAWNRTSDTRSRNHAEGVTSSRAPWAKALLSPTFCADPAIAPARGYWAVVVLLVGNAAAIATVARAQRQRPTAGPVQSRSAASFGQARAQTVDNPQSGDAGTGRNPVGPWSPEAPIGATTANESAPTSGTRRRTAMGAGATSGTQGR